MFAGELISGRYRLVEPIGSGAAGRVWRAHDERLQREVAVKVVDLSKSSEIITEKRFRREVIATASLNNPAIVTTYDGGIEGNVAYLVMELLRGESVAQRLARGPLPIGEACRIGAEVARALMATHAIGVVHRDIKPANVMVTGEAVKVLDFGIARIDNSDMTGLQAIGTAAYMAPEQALGQSVTPAADMYALGCFLMALVTGHPPFHGETAVAVAQQQISAVPPRMSSRRADTPPTLDALVVSLLAKDPGQRPNAAQVRGVLSQGFAVPPRQQPPARTALLTPRPQPPMPAAPTAVLPVAPRPVAPPPRRKLRRAFKGVMFALVALVFVTIAWMVGTHLGGITVPTPSPSAVPSTTTPKPTTPKPTSPVPRTSSSIAVPMPSLPSLPPLDGLGLKSAVASVTSTLDGWRPTSDAERKSKQALVSSWTKESNKILAGQGASSALKRFEDVLDQESDAGSVPMVTEVSLRSAVGALRLLV